MVCGQNKQTAPLTPARASLGCAEIMGAGEDAYLRTRLVETVKLQPDYRFSLDRAEQRTAMRLIGP